MKKKYKGAERRQFLRLVHTVPLAYKVCKRTTVSKLLKGYTSNISSSGLLCSIKERVKKGDIILFGKYAGTEVKIEDNDYLIIREEDILGIVEKTK